MSPEEQSEFGEILESFKDARDNNDTTAGAEALGRFMEHVGKQDDEPSPYLLALRKAHECEAQFDWAGAEDAFHEAITASADNRGNQAQAWGYLSRFFAFLDDEEQAWEATLQAVAVARTLEYPLSLVQALGSEIVFRLRRNELDGVRALLHEQLALIDSRPIALQLFKKGVPLVRAQLEIKSGDLEAAHATLEELWPAVEAAHEWTFLPGEQMMIASWWETKAALCAAHNDLDGEIEALREVIQPRIFIAQAPQLEGPYKFNALARAFFRLAKVLQRVDEVEAKELFDQSADIREGIGRPPFDE